MNCVAFDRIGHLVRVPVRMPDGGTARFLVDTGIGVSLVSTALAAQYDLSPVGSVTGHRMSGQAVTSPTTLLPTIGVAGVGFGSRVVAIADLGTTDGPDGFDGILGLDLLGDETLTINPFTRTLNLGRCAGQTGSALRVRVRAHRDGPAIDLRADLRLPDGAVIEVEIDTGSAVTILDSALMAACGVDGTEPGARSVDGTDETGHRFHRRFIPIPGSISLLEAPATIHRQPTVMFQDLAMDGLIGTDFLDRFVQTYDTVQSLMTLAAPPG